MCDLIVLQTIKSGGKSDSKMMEKVSVTAAPCGGHMGFLSSVKVCPVFVFLF